ncbi:MAG: topology modulation protein [Eubacteriales bacterium]|nr:topology modulation protein [Eubacteriales bacterium]
MERILIIGCSGSGKSRLARELGQKLSLPVIHLDQLWWKENWQNVTMEEFDSRLAMALNMDRWIIDGNYSRTMEVRLSKCDTVIYLDFSRWACLLGMFQRLLSSHGKTRTDMSAGCPERFNWEFVKWIWNFNKNNRVQNYTYLAKAKHAESIVLHNRKEAKMFLDSITA